MTVMSSAAARRHLKAARHAGQVADAVLDGGRAARRAPRRTRDRGEDVVDVRLAKQRRLDADRRLDGVRTSKRRPDKRKRQRSRARHRPGASMA